MAGLAKAPHYRFCDICWIRRFESSWSPCPCWLSQTVIGKVGIPACDSQATDKFAYANEYYRQSHTHTNKAKYNTSLRYQHNTPSPQWMLRVYEGNKEGILWSGHPLPPMDPLLTSRPHRHYRPLVVAYGYPLRNTHRRVDLNRSTSPSPPTARWPCLDKGYGVTSKQTNKQLANPLG